MSGTEAGHSSELCPNSCGHSCSPALSPAPIILRRKQVPCSKTEIKQGRDPSLDVVLPLLAPPWGGHLHQPGVEAGAVSPWGPWHLPAHPTAAGSLCSCWQLLNPSRPEQHGVFLQEQEHSACSPCCPERDRPWESPKGRTSTQGIFKDLQDGGLNAAPRKSPLARSEGCLTAPLFIKLQQSNLWHPGTKGWEQLSGLSRHVPLDKGTHTASALPSLGNSCQNHMAGAVRRNFPVSLCLYASRCNCVL